MQTEDTRANYYALFLSIVYKMSSSCSLQLMGLSTKEGRKLILAHPELVSK